MFMMNVMKLKQLTGVALVQVLFITAILSLMALHFTLTSRQQVDVASILQDKVMAELQLLSWQNELLYTLMTSEGAATIAENAPDRPISKHWNFYGKPFSPAENVTISIQDIEGLLSISTPGKQAQLRSVLSHLKVSDDDILRIVSELEHQQGLPTNIYRAQRHSVGREMFVQSLAEIKSLPGMNAELYSTLSEILTRLPSARFNPLHAPDILLRALLPSDIANQAIVLREAGELNTARYAALTRIEDYEMYSFVRGERMQIEIEVTHGAAVAKQRFICYIRPENQFPLIWLD
jgi:general secretion pathway protein K